MVTILAFIVFSQSNLNDSIIEIKPHYLMDGMIGVIGGMVGFGALTYTTAAFLAGTKNGGINFPGEVGYIMGYTLGIPIGATSFIHYNPFNRYRSQKAFKSALKYSLLGAQIGLGFLLIGSNISRDAKYWVGAFILTIPIAGAIKGYHSAPFKLQEEIGPAKGTMREINYSTLAVHIKIIEFKLR